MGHKATLMSPSHISYAWLLLCLGLNLGTYAHIVTQAPTATSVTAVSECHLHSSTQYCQFGTQEYRVNAVATQTTDLPATYTDCHAHFSSTYCLSPSGEEVEVVPAEAEGDDHEHDHEHEHEEEGEGHGEMNCHFHAGVEHCTGGSESESQRICTRVDRDYNIPLRIGLLFVMLATSCIGVFGPILFTSLLRVKPTALAFTLLKQFGTGVIFSTAFVHLFTHANLMFTNECLGELAYEGTTSAIVMAGIFMSFLLEYIGQRYVQARRESKKAAGVNCSSHDPMETLGVMVLEGGIIFHSLLIGVTVVVAGDSVFGVLFVVIVFHQMFEGIALGSRIAELGSKDLPGSVKSISLGRKLLMASAFAITTPIGMAIGIGVLHEFNGNDPATIVAIGTLDAFSAGILIWVGIVEMWAHDWIHGELATAGPLKTSLGLFGLVAGAVVMSVLAKWA